MVSVKPYLDEIAAYLAAGNKKGLAQQCREVAALYRKYGTFPRQYFRAQLYLADRQEDVSGYMPYALIRKLQRAELDRDSELILNDKLRFHRHAVRHAIPVPRLLFYRAGGVLRDHEDRAITRRQAADLVAREGVAIMKPISGQFGRGVRRLRLDDVEAVDDEDDVLVQELIDQHPALARFHPSSINCLRVVTWNERGSPTVVACALKIGIGGSLVDNLGTAGGLAARIDVETGRIMGPARRPATYTTLPLHHHPDTGAPIDGEIPFWPEVKAAACTAAAAFPRVRTIGWDIAIARQGPLVVEGNLGWGPYLFQLLGVPLGKTVFGTAAAPYLPARSARP